MGPITVFACNPSLESTLIEETREAERQHQADLVAREFQEAMQYGSCDACQSPDHTGLFVDGPDRVCEGCLMLELDD